MKTVCRISCVAIVVVASVLPLWRASAQDVKEKAFAAPHNLSIKVRMEGPYTADVPLQIVCYFKYTPESAKRMSGAPVELDKRLGGVIASLRERGEFIGDEGETLLIIPPKDSIKAKALLLVGLGAEDNLSLKTLEGVGRIGLREAARLGVKRVGFAPLIRDQGNKKLNAGDVEVALIQAMLLAYDTDKRMQKEGLARPFALDEWLVEAGPEFFDETAGAVQTAIKEANTIAGKRTSDPYAMPK